MVIFFFYMERDWPKATDFITRYLEYKFNRIFSDKVSPARKCIQYTWDNCTILRTCVESPISVLKALRRYNWCIWNP